MSAINIDGAIIIESAKHAVGYEPGSMTGSSTLFLRLLDGDQNVPIYVRDVDIVIEMLQRGKRAIESLEPVD